MKKLFIAIAALAAMTSCSQDEVMEVAEKQAISFGNAFIENATRAIDPSLTDATLKDFQVWGTVQGSNNGTATLTSIFNDIKVEGTVGENRVWNTAVTQYWIPGAVYNFAALKNATVTAADLGADLLPKTVTFTNNGQTDLLYAKIAKPYTAQATNGPVNMDFKHMLAKAVVTVSNTTDPGEGKSTGYYYKVSNVQITTAHTTGTCTLSTENPEWSKHSGTSTLNFGNITGTTNGTDAIELGDNTKKAASYNEVLLIPTASTATKESVTIKFNLDLYKDNGNETDELINHTEGKTVTGEVKFVAGYAYSFNISLSVGAPIQFSVTSAPTWATPVNDVTVK